MANRYGSWNHGYNNNNHYRYDSIARRPNELSRNKEKRRIPFNICKKMSFIVLILSTLWIWGGNTNVLSQLSLKMNDIEHVREKEGYEFCENGKEYMLERHDFDSSHGDVCRHTKSGNFVCPKNCQGTLMYAEPYCLSSSKKTSQPCRIPRTNEYDTVYNCNMQGGERGVCMNFEQSSGFASQNGKYYDYKSCQESCHKEAQTNKKGEKVLFSWPWMQSSPKPFHCENDWDCSLAGTCNKNNGQCQCDTWATGIDCSYLDFQPVDKSKLGYGFQTPHSSWGGSVVYHDSLWHMYVSEIICDGSDVRKTRCGLSKWQTNSQVVHATSTHVGGPYQRQEVVLSTEHHNPTVQTVSKSQMDTSWYLYSISDYDGPIEVIVSTDFGNSWTAPKIVSKHQNPGPLFNDDGTMTMYYRSDKGGPSVGPCSKEYIGRQICSSPTGPCQNTPHKDKKGKPIFRHTAEDPMVFRDARGNYHMLINALPYTCTPKFQQGAHAWSRDGIHWSEPRLGAYNTTILFQDGTHMTCERRERPQMIFDPETKTPLALVSAVVGCPRSKLAPMSPTSFTYRGNDDSFTLVQLMQQ